MFTIRYAPLENEIIVTQNFVWIQYDCRTTRYKWDALDKEKKLYPYLIDKFRLLFTEDQWLALCLLTSWWISWWLYPDIPIVEKRNKSFIWSRRWRRIVNKPVSSDWNIKNMAIISKKIKF